ncbi:ABC transporter ATP-binding protein [Phycisphaera mikurensis]|uniref:Putative ABC transporter ATP-binding protein n=1 Tax=Phycisphaera mikurensis (strain NBRC 102666 / KCTC 22515 / FYK2301M01) TaxID=1142394 RepID=I0IHL2_PHYMF|nr:ABC transporter ATP-binding protein [Phycisphaera mikurensis]MBB6440995.1 ABC-2 type transport system ATP-binding protein [Phycisphaera mikurensis]BAM04750.1 putative ABC transporter ATP-binding protein [Phycisphaera mikurensis NBRC 102666]
MEPVLTCTGLAKAYGKHLALEPLDWEVHRGGVVAILGRNGSCKSTLIRLVMGLEAPTAGGSTLLGCPSTELTPEIRERVGYLIEGHPTHTHLRVRQLAASEADLHPRFEASILDRVLDHFRIEPEQKAGSLSRGQRGGLMLGLALAAQPELLVMDDPTLGLDPVAKRALREALLFTTRDPGRTVVIATHDLADVERLADRVAVFDRGSLRAWCSTEVLGERVLRVRVSAVDGSFTDEAFGHVPGLLTGRIDPGGSEAELMIVTPSEAGLDEEQEDALDRLGRVEAVVQPGFEAAAMAYLEEGPVSEGFLAGVAS